ncbi:MAG: YaiI/YqxD family protein [Pseudomonadota bacterium]
MKIWVDADACPVVVKEILFRAATRTGVQLTLVANQPLSTPPADNIKTLQVPRGFDVADDEIVTRLTARDIVITSDIPRAAEVIEKGGHALSPRGEMHTTENIGARLNMRDFLDTMRASGVETGGGPNAFSQRDKQAFANHLDRFLAKFASEPDDGQT